MWRTAEPKINGQKPVVEPVSAPSITSAPPAAAHAAAGLGLATEQATLGATVVVKGEITGSQPLYVDGRVEGSIHFPNHRVTIGRKAVVLANVMANEVVIMGAVTGNIDCMDRVDVRSDAVLTGDVVTQRICIDEGALVKGRVEVSRSRNREAFGKTVATVQAAARVGEVATKSAAVVAPSAPRAAAAVAGSASQVAGSSVLFEENKSVR